jgi:hypothetical protein
MIEAKLGTWICSKYGLQLECYHDVRDGTHAVLSVDGSMDMMTSAIDMKCDAV